MSNNYTAEEQEVLNYFTNFEKTSLATIGQVRHETLNKAFNFAFEAHRGARRKSGELYMWHPLKVAEIVVDEMGMGTKSAIAAFLHDVVEDTEYTIEDVETLFGEKIAYIVNGLTKLPKEIHTDRETKIEDFRNLLLTISGDMRVVIIKLADRLHNMRTLQTLPEHRQTVIAAETLDVYAPLAHRIGLYEIKSELEDLSFKYLQKSTYLDLESRLRGSEKKRMYAINNFILPIAEALDSEAIKYDIDGRLKTIYSIWNKMQTKNVSLDEVYDIYAIRIVFEPIAGLSEKTQCWHIYSIITNIYTPKTDRIRDWVSMPKANGYEALHVTVMGPHGEWVEVQIRTRRMDELASLGLAAHWKYKGIESQDTAFDRLIQQVREQHKQPSQDAWEFLDNFKADVLSPEIFVFTHKGDLRKLPVNSTVLDFAFHVHTELGLHCMGAKVNHKTVSPEYILNSGDKIEVISSKNQRPKQAWINTVVTSKARNQLKSALVKERKQTIRHGEELLDKILVNLDIELDNHVLRKLIVAFDTKNKTELFFQIGLGTINESEVGTVLKKRSKSKLVRYWKFQFQRKPTTKNKTLWTPEKFAQSGNLVNIDQKEDIEIELADCCFPIQGDEIIGIKQENRMMIHKKNCQIVQDLSVISDNSFYTVSWKSVKKYAFLARLVIKGVDQIGIVHRITQIISNELNINMRTICFDANQYSFNGRVELYVQNTSDLNKLIYKIKKIKGLKTIERVSQFK